MPDGKQVSKTFESQFIQPGQSQHFSLSSDDMKGIYFTDFTKDADDKPLWTWLVEPLTGLTIPHIKVDSCFTWYLLVIFRSLKLGSTGSPFLIPKITVQCRTIRLLQ